MPTSDRFSIEHETRDGRAVVRLHGDLDIAAAPELAQALLAAEATDAHEICLDLSGLRFMDSTGLVEILKANARSRQDSSRLTIIRGPSQIQRLFEMTGADADMPFREPER